MIFLNYYIIICCFIIKHSYVTFHHADKFYSVNSLLFNQHRTKRPEPHELLRIFRFPQYEGRDIARIAETIEQTLEIVQRHVEAGMKFNLTGKN